MAEVVTGGVPLKGPWILLFILFASWSPRGDFALPLAPCHAVLVHPRPRVTDKPPGCEPQGPGARMTLSSFKWIISDIL